MAVKIRLKRMGKKKQPSYRVVVADSRSPRDGRIIESIGRYDPRQEPSLVEIDTERAKYWIGNGAQPTERAQKLLEIAGAVEVTAGRGSVYSLESGKVEAKAVPPPPKAEEAPAEAADDTAPEAEAPAETDEAEAADDAAEAPAEESDES